MLERIKWMEVLGECSCLMARLLTHEWILIRQPDAIWSAGVAISWVEILSEKE
jgi:hypothetical protein